MWNTMLYARISHSPLHAVSRRFLVTWHAQYVKICVRPSVVEHVKLWITMLYARISHAPLHAVSRRFLVTWRAQFAKICVRPSVVEHVNYHVICTYLTYPTTCGLTQIFGNLTRSVRQNLRETVRSGTYDLTCCINVSHELLSVRFMPHYTLCVKICRTPPNCSVTITDESWWKSLMPFFLTNGRTLPCPNLSKFLLFVLFFVYFSYIIITN